MIFWQKSSEKCELLGLSAVLGEFFCGHCIVTCCIGKRNVLRTILVQNRNTFHAYIYAYVLSHKFTLLDYSKESIHGIPGTKFLF